MHTRTYTHAHKRNTGGRKFFFSCVERNETLIYIGGVIDEGKWGIHFG